ncbi:hypothetical protein GGR50DRAFT_315261 [Xylaria sp. CBS 124048]|nr:hypothetical protein GGR50DRAFT_315261 [Xylaria sp. CBS 124048]
MFIFFIFYFYFFGCMSDQLRCGNCELLILGSHVPCHPVYSGTKSWFPVMVSCHGSLSREPSTRNLRLLCCIGSGAVN